ncbi:hypothetical protein BaRGS_00017087 [Batillaria attramentaria]|uniref:Uncharacterized protein n=1 Tax=Batillaria attramentaria TaxID=370345 RepID=A0ABD0KXT0_9CAEN
MGLDATKVYKTFKFPVRAEGAANDPQDDYNIVIGLFDAYFVPKKNIFHERTQFYPRSQHNGEPVETFLRAISDLSLTCNFDNPEEAIRDRLVLGLQDQEVARKLQLEENPTLETAISTARSNWKLIKWVCLGKAGMTQSILS